MYVWGLGSDKAYECTNVSVDIQRINFGTCHILLTRYKGLLLATNLLYGLGFQENGEKMLRIHMTWLLSTK